MVARQSYRWVSMLMPAHYRHSTLRPRTIGAETRCLPSTVICVPLVVFHCNLGIIMYYVSTCQQQWCCRGSANQRSRSIHVSVFTESSADWSPSLMSSVELDLDVVSQLTFQYKQTHSCIMLLNKVFCMKSRSIHTSIPLLSSSDQTSVIILSLVFMF